MSTRPVSVSHLVFGLVFLGVTAMWAVGTATDADAPDMALLGPSILIAAGVVGLVALALNARNARIRDHRLPEDTTDHPDADPGVVTTEEIQ